MCKATRDVRPVSGVYALCAAFVSADVGLRPAGQAMNEVYPVYGKNCSGQGEAGERTLLHGYSLHIAVHRAGQSDGQRNRTDI